MLSSTETQPRCLTQVVVNVLTALLLLAAAPAIADVTLEGVTEGQVVTGDLEVSAVSTEHRLTDLMIVLSGPDGTEIVNRSGLSRVHLIHAPDDMTAGLPWDSTQATAGSYTVAAYATARGRTGNKVSTAVVTFVVENDNQPAALASLAANTAVQTQPEVTAQGVEKTAEAAQPTEARATPEPTLTVDPPILLPSATAHPTIAFASDAPTQRVIGDSAAVTVELENAADNADVLILVWDLDRRAMVEGFALVMDPSSLVISSGLLDSLPAGDMELQAHYRVNDKIQQTVKHILVNAEPAVVASGPDAMPTFAFAADASSTHTVGSTQSLSFAPDGDLPGNGDVLAIAWSLDEGRLIPGFAQVFSQGPWTISADMLNLLPQGRNEIQLRPRYNGQITGKVVHMLTVSAPALAELPQPADPADGSDPVPGEDALADGGDENTDPVVDATPDTGTSDPVATPTESANVSIAFAAGSVSQYTPGSGDSITIDLDGTLPAGADVLMLMWHKDRGEMVDGFAHELSGTNLVVDSAKLDAVPAGNVELQALLRVPGELIVVRKMGMLIIDPNVPIEEQLADDSGDANTNYDNLDLTSDGFTKFTKSKDTRVIYVAANGNDSNDGLSTAKPMRTASAAYKKLRDGYPDWLLFKSGDTFRGNLGTISKSGRSSSEPMLISTYGEGDRPIFLSPNGTWAEKFFQTNGDHVAFVGLHIIAEKRDFNRSGFTSNMSSDVWNASAITFLGDADDLLIEDCIMEYFKFAIVVQSTPNDGYATNIKIRRNAVLNSYGHWDKKVAGHSSGMYGAYLDGLLIEENVWHHNGWSTKVSGAGKTKFNHNMYIQDNCTGNSMVRGNIISNGSAHGLQLRSGGDIVNNLFVGNPLAFFTGRYESDVLRNVVLKSQDLDDEDRGHGFEILPCINARVENNIVSQKQGSASFAYAIAFNHNDAYSKFLNGRPFKASLKDNKVYKWPRDNGASSAIKFGTKPQMSENTRNNLDKASGGSSDPPWIDPERDVESYMSSIGKSASLDALIKGASFRPRGQWVEEFSADAINLYIRRGFDVKPFD